MNRCALPAVPGRSAAVVAAPARPLTRAPAASPVPTPARRRPVDAGDRPDAADAAAHSGRAGHAREGSRAGGLQSERLQLRRHRHHHDRRRAQPTTSPIPHVSVIGSLRIGRRATCRPASNLPRTPSSRSGGCSDAQLGRRRHGRSGADRISRCRWWRSISPATRARRRQSGARQPQRARVRPARAATPRARPRLASRRWPAGRRAGPPPAPLGERRSRPAARDDQATLAALPPAGAIGRRREPPQDPRGIQGYPCRHEGG